MSDYGQDHMEDIIKEEKEKELAREFDDGKMQSWIYNHHQDLVNEFIEGHTDFENFCEERWREIHE